MQQPTMVQGAYLIDAPLAKGGMGEVLLGRRTGAAGFSRRVVIKRVRNDRPELANRLLDEAKLAALVHHPNVCQVLDLGTLDGRYFIAMEFVDGVDVGGLLKRCMERNQQLRDEVCAWLVAEAARGLHAAHEVADPLTGRPLELVHCDVSHRNILVSRHGAVKVTDFGIAKAVAQMAGRARLEGKKGYIAPERIAGQPFDRRADIYALGVVLWEMMAGCRFEQGILGIDGRPETLLDICETATGVDPSTRFPTADAMAEALDAWRSAVGGVDPRGELQSLITTNCLDLLPDGRSGHRAEASMAQTVDAKRRSPAPSPTLNEAPTRPLRPKQPVVEDRSPTDPDKSELVQWAAEALHSRALRAHTPDGVEARRWLADQLERVTEAHSWALAQKTADDATAALQIAAGAAELWMDRGPASLLGDWLDASIGVARAEALSEDGTFALGLALSARAELNGRFRANATTGIRDAEASMRTLPANRPKARAMAAYRKAY